MKIIIMTDEEIKDLQALTVLGNTEAKKFSSNLINRLNEPEKHTTKALKLYSALVDSYTLGELSLFTIISDFTNKKALQQALNEDGRPDLNFILAVDKNIDDNL